MPCTSNAVPERTAYYAATAVPQRPRHHTAFAALEQAATYTANVTSERPAHYNTTSVAPVHQARFSRAGSSTACAGDRELCGCARCGGCCTISTSSGLCCYPGNKYKRAEGLGNTFDWIFFIRVRKYIRVFREYR